MIVGTGIYISAEMALLTHKRNPELSARVTGPESILRIARDEPIPSIQVPMLGNDEDSSVATQEKKARNRFEQWLQKASSATDEERAGKVPAPTGPDEVKEISLESEGGDGVVWLSEVKR